MKPSDGPTGTLVLGKLSEISPQILGNMAVQLTKRELFAAMAMQGFAVSRSTAATGEDGTCPRERVAVASVELADALIAALEKEREC